MDCSEIEAAILRGARPDGPGLDEHLAGCASCRFLLDGGTPVAQALAGSAPPVAEVDLAALAAATEARLARERGPAAAARALPRPVRFLLIALLMALVAAAFVAIYRLRTDWSVYPALRMALVLGGIGALALLLVWHALRPIYLPPLSSGLARALLAAGVAAPVLAALLPELPTLINLPGTPAHYAVKCFLLGSAQALLVFAVARALARGGTGAVRAAAAAGLAGVVGLVLHCPINHPDHLLLGHATVPVGLILGYLLAGRGWALTKS